MDSEEPPNVRVACSGDIDEVVRLMHDAAAWMSAKGTPAWDVARIDRTFAETFVLRSELLVASCSDGIVGCCTLSAEDPEFWPDALKGEAAYLHKLAVRRTHAGRGVSSALIEACRHAARTTPARPPGLRGNMAPASSMHQVPQPMVMANWVFLMTKQSCRACVQ
ncbi:GNAT family N-acetyltransferase [Trichlorobacter lovleyi]|uniref:GNAT family N-acetyltransferase n=1 Tax=Trichlorobacter lovleyi TaxID=313985 RepID=UPI002ACD43D5|nr:GNAT family N-acetyltransferase [Trichlorobacter lovleyi]